MTAKQFILKRNFTVALTKKEEETYFTSMLQPSEYLKLMDEYASYVLSVAAEKAKIAMKKKSNYGTHRKWQNVKEDEVDLFAYEVMYFVDKNSILNCLKD